MALTNVASQPMNKKKVKLLKKKRTQIRNQKKVHALQHGNTQTLRKPRASKKKQQKDAKRRRIYVEGEKAKLLKSGVITQADVEAMEAKQAKQETQTETPAAETMDVDN